MSNFLTKGFIASILAIFLTWAYLVMPQSFFSLNNNFQDYFFSFRGELPKYNNVVIVDIDEKSLQQYGQWPWSRSVVSGLIQTMSDADAGIIGLDIVFAESDKTSPHTIASKLSEEHKSKFENYDAILANTIAHTQTVGGYVFTFEEKLGDAVPLIPAVFIEKGLKENESLSDPRGIVLNIDLLQKNFYSSGFFNVIPDDDGVVRRVPLFLKYDETIFPSLVLEMVRIYSGISNVEIEGDEFGVHHVNFGEFNIPTDMQGRLIINFRGPKNHFKYISAADILNGDFDKNEIAGKFVLVGTSALGLFDLRATPFDSDMPGIEVHANILDNILQGDFLHESINNVLYDILIIWSLVFLLMILFSYVNSWLYLPVALLIGYALFAGVLYQLFKAGVVVNILFPFLAFVGVLMVSISIDYFFASRQKEFLQRIFAKKVSKSVMDDLINKADENILEVHEQNVAIFFSDIRNFTTLSESIGSSQKLVQLLNRYMTPMVEEISQNEGTVDKFIGDAIMAYWNAPNRIEHYADKAVWSALKQIEILSELNNELEIEYGVRLQIGIAIHTGRVTVGEMGSLGRSDYTIIGDNVNLASRLEGLNKLYGTKIIISEDTKNLLDGEYRFRPLDIVRVKGKHQATEVFEVLQSHEDISKELAEYGVALELYRSGRVEDAYEHFKILVEKYEHTIYDIYLQRCKTYLENPDKAFDHVFTMSDK